MNNKVCVDLIVPSIEERYNVFLPVNKKTLEVVYLLNKAIADMSNGEFPMTTHLSLLNSDSGLMYDMDKTILENEILNGSKLILL